MDDAVYCATLLSGKAQLVRVETELARGLRRILLVGMADAVAKEARERLPSAFHAHGFSFPKGKVLFNLAPAQCLKRGFPMDLALGVSLLQAQGKLPGIPPTLFLAEFDLDGRLGAPAKGTLLAAIAACKQGVFQCITTPKAAQEASMAPGISAFGFEHFGEVIQFLQNSKDHRCAQPSHQEVPRKTSGTPLRLDDVRGQFQARKAAVIAAAGRHSLLLQGPPGTGKSLLAKRIPLFLEDLTDTKSLQLAQIESQLGPLHQLPRSPPFRAPHASVSAQGIFGGGNPLRPGELSRAHGGILFLDELPEFSRPILEGLRQPLEDQEVRLQRARDWAVFPADILLIAASNPCPCGFLTHPDKACSCTPARLQQYQLKTSGPLLDRFDLFVEMGPVAPQILQGDRTPPFDEDLTRKIQQAKEVQKERRRQGKFRWSSTASMEEIQTEGFHESAKVLLSRAAEHLHLSGRGILRTLRVARTIADLEGADEIQKDAVAQALSFRFIQEEVQSTIKRTPLLVPNGAWARTSPHSQVPSKTDLESLVESKLKETGG